MANVLDYLLPKSFMTDVGATFKPKEYDFTMGEFMGGEDEVQDIYSLYQDIRELGYEPNADYARWIENLTDSGKQWIDGTLQGTVEDPETGERFDVNQLKSQFQMMKVAAGGSKFGPGASLLSSKFATAGGAGGGAEILPSLFGTEEQVGKIFEQSGLYDYEPGMASPLKLSQLRGLDPGAYAKQIETKRGTLADALTRKRQRAAGLGSGFAGYGERSFAEDLAEEQYETGVEDVYAGVGKERAGALQQLYADIDDYGQSIKAMTD